MRVQKNVTNIDYRSKNAGEKESKRTFEDICQLPMRPMTGDLQRTTGQRQSARARKEHVEQPAIATSHQVFSEGRPRCRFVL